MYSKEVKTEAINMYRQGIKISRISEILDIPHRTISRWLIKSGFHKPVSSPRRKYLAEYRRRMRELDG